MTKRNATADYLTMNFLKIGDAYMLIDASMAVAEIRYQQLFLSEIMFAPQISILRERSADFSGWLPRWLVGEMESS